MERECVGGEGGGGVEEMGRWLGEREGRREKWREG